VDSRDQEWVRQRALNVIGHELRTPASTVRGLAEVLAAGTNPDDRPDLIDALVRNARRLEALVDDLLAASNVTTALPVGPAEPVDLAERVRTSWTEEGGIEVAGSGVVLARRVSVTRILGAVLDNALAYGARPVRVTLAASGEHVRMVVESPGDELSSEDVRFALEPFWRGERAVTTRSGLGLGLTVASKLAEHEGGHLWVEGREGGGMVTFIELPAR
jgi:signal transduction histidine kinase